MTKEEAMDELKFLKKTLLRKEEIEALDIAIKALQEYEISDTVKLIIEIDQGDYERIKEYYDTHDTVEVTYGYIRHGIPLDDVKTEIVALPKIYPFVNHIDTYVKEDDVLEILDNMGKEESEEV